MDKRIVPEEPDMTNRWQLFEKITMVENPNFIKLKFEIRRRQQGNVEGIKRQQQQIKPF